MNGVSKGEKSPAAWRGQGLTFPFLSLRHGYQNALHCHAEEGGDPYEIDDLYELLVRYGVWGGVDACCVDSIQSTSGCMPPSASACPQRGRDDCGGCGLAKRYTVSLNFSQFVEDQNGPSTSQIHPF